MSNQRTVVLVGLLMVIGGIPAVSAEHLSVGYEDAPGVGPNGITGAETAANPSVPGPTDNGEVDTPYERGLQQDCFEANGSVDARQIEDAAASDPFCGHLVYQPDNKLKQTSPPDQVLTDAIGGDDATFDVITTRSYMLAHELRLVRNDIGTITGQGGGCHPFCEDNPAENQFWNALHTVGAAAGLTESPEDANENARDDRTQIYGADVHTPTSRTALQAAGTHEMNGWYVPGPTRSFVAFLFDGQGNAIGETEVANLVDNPQVDLPAGAEKTVCGFTPDGDFTSTGGSFTCEIPFEFEGTGDNGVNFNNGYKDKCDSPTYICSASSGPAWYANFDCLCSTFALDDFVRFHWVVAPTLADCGAREPGFLTNPGTGLPFLAHDLDVYTNAGTLSTTDATHGLTNVDNAVTEMVGEQTDDVGEGVPGLVDEVPGVGDLGPDAAVLTQVSKEDRVEPNAKAVGTLADTSQSMPTEHPDGADLQREAGVGCSALTSSEDDLTIDPWVDIIDGSATRAATEGANLTVNAAGLSPTVQAQPGLYLNEDEGQDDDNHPGPEVYQTSGNVGMFTDKDDDGEYDTVAGDTLLFSASKTKSDDIAETGAYPMLWDVRVEETNGNFQFDTDSGCQISGDGLTQGAIDAGYGTETALFQALYLREPTVFVDQDNGEAAPYPAGNNIYLLLSQSAKAHYGPDADNVVDDRIDSVVAELKAHASALGAAEPSVELPGDEVGLTSDFQDQCPEPTGGFTSELSFAHYCTDQVTCEGDTIVTGYTFELVDDELGGGNFLPPFPPSDFTWGSGQYDWLDVDPLDNDPSRQDDTYERPPTGED